MDYASEMLAFYDWLETNTLSANAVLTWYALMHTNCKCFWKNEFAVAISVLSLKTGGVSRKSIERARNELQQKGLIQWKERPGNQSAMYTMIPFVRHTDEQNVAQRVAQPVVQRIAQTVVQPVAQPVAINPPSPSYPSGTQKNTVVTVGNPAATLYDPAIAEVVRAYEAEIGMISPTVSQTLDGWCEDFEPSMLLAVIHDAALSGKRNAKYIDAILRSKQRQGITTLAGYQEAERAFQDKKQRVDMPEYTRIREVYR